MVLKDQNGAVALQWLRPVKIQEFNVDVLVSILLDTVSLNSAEVRGSRSSKYPNLCFSTISPLGLAGESKFVLPSTVS